MIQARLPEAAEQYAKQIPMIDSDCSLAKAEALSAAGAAWLEANNARRAQEDFEAAAGLWRLADSRAGPDIVRAWRDAGRVNDAIAFARGIAEAPQRAEALLILAQSLLNRAGAPSL